MKDKNYKLAKYFTLIPFICFLIFGSLGVYYVIVDKMSSTMLGFILASYCTYGAIATLVFGILGIGYSSKSKKEISKGTIWLVFGILDIVSVAICFLSILTLLLGAAGQM